MDGKKSSKNLEPKKTQNGGKYAKEESCSEGLHACLYLCAFVCADGGMLGPDYTFTVPQQEGKGDG